ncbi:predicted protein [Sparassis crispa]|uniref:Protein kinase domain-containing protein n=1 Tax=Sparassis crispa TaxID=139825 RepID=A0A401G9S2_9APHY|nr:predicted protein [Sparassis crispa]GBE78924.1 predicted protein [Sparassis crispa]
MKCSVSDFPSWTLCTPDEAQGYAKATAEGLYALLPNEIFWRDRQVYLEEHGYQLRPRYRPGWSPSWLEMNVTPSFCEDSISLLWRDVIDATRKADGELVSLKSVEKDGSEVTIARFLSRPELRLDPTNHCVPMVDILPDPIDSKAAILIMLYLRPFNDPGFGAIGEVVEFMRQTLEGLCFLHDQGVAHRDCAAANIMMDARSLYPHGHHPIRIAASQDGIHMLAPLSRSDCSVRYYFIDFGISSLIKKGESPYVLGRQGRDKELPELSSEITYDAFKVDIFTLGNLYKKEFLQAYLDLEFLEPLVQKMTAHSPDQRPTAAVAFAVFESIRHRQSSSLLRWRLRRRDETAPERVVYDTMAAAREGIYRLRHFVR